MQAGVDWVLIIFGTQVIKKKRPVRPVFPDYLSVSYDYTQINGCTFSFYFADFNTSSSLLFSVYFFSPTMGLFGKSFLLHFRYYCYLLHYLFYLSTQCIMETINQLLMLRQLLLQIHNKCVSHTLLLVRKFLLD